MEYNKWLTVAVCKCGEVTEAPFGRLFHIHFEVCPQCGENKSKMELKTGRCIPKFWSKSYWEFKE